MKNILNKLILCTLLVLVAAQGKLYAQPGVPPTPYCMPMYFAIPCNSPFPPNTPGNGINDFIDSFNTTGGVVNITNNNSTCNSQVIPGFGQVNYMYFGCQHYLQTVPGANIVCNLRSGMTYPQGFSIWVDWNQNNLFTDPGELVAWTTVPPAFTFISTNFTVPPGQATGTYRMRVRCIYVQAGNTHTPCGATTYGEAEDYNLYVNMPPPGVITSTALVNSPICSGQSATFSVATTYTGALTYTWTGPGAFTSTLANPVIPNAQPTVSGVYTVIVSPGSCPQTKTVQLNVNPTPTVIPGNNSPICQGGAINLTVAAVPGGTLVTYNWNGPGSYTSNVQNPVIANAQPTNSGVYSLTVVNSFTNGGTCSAGNTTTVAVVPVEAITVTPTFTLCQNSNLNLTAQNNVAPMSYSWTGPNAFSSALQNPIINNTLPIHSGDYWVVATFSTPGIPLTCTSSAVSNVSIVATSPVTVTVPQNICEHATAVLTVTTNPQAISYMWTGPNSYTASGTNTTIPNISPSSSGLYNVVATWAIGTVSCTMSGLDQINVVPTPTISVNAPISVCYPANVGLTSSAPTAISYSWTGPNSFTSNIASPIIASPSVSASGIYTITTAYTNNALICYMTNTTQVTVNPIIPFTLEPFRQVCFNSTYTLSGPAGATSYTWTGPDGSMYNNQILSIPAIQSQMAGTYTLNLHLGPCMTSGTTKIDVLSPIQFTQTPGNKVICAGDSVKLIMGSAGGSQNYAYVWNPQQWLGSPTGSVQYGQPQGTTIYNVMGYDIACPNHTISTSFTVTVNKAPMPNLQLAKHEGCQPLCLNLNTKTQEDATQVTYDFGNGNVMQADNFDYCLTEPGTYNLRIMTRGKNGCNAVYTHPAPIVVNPTPHTDLTWSPEVPSTTQNNITFIPNAEYGPVTEYQWEFQGTNGVAGYDTSSMKNPMRTYDNIGKYPVMVISRTDKGCIDTVFKVIEVIDEFSIFIPNTFTPNGDNLNDVFNIKGVGIKHEGYSMEIYDRWGTLVYSSKDLTKGWDGTVKGILAENGVYIYMVKALGANGEGKKEFTGHVTLIK